jgi:hypothetical protein
MKAMNNRSIMKKLILFFTVYIGFNIANGQTGNNRFKNGLILYLNNDSTHFIKATFLNQTWVRYNENNPGSNVFGYVEKNTFDIGLRRTRMQLYGLITDRVFVYTQFGQNNFNYLSIRKTSAFFHDVTLEYALSPKHLWLGAGLTGWTGLSRFASPAVGTILMLDAPLFQQATNDATDQFLRKLSVYGKGKLGKLDYRIILSKPMAIQNSNLYSNKISEHSDFARTPAKVQYHGYFMYQVLDQESNQIPYNTGTYLGKKRIFNIGAGFIYQKNAMSHLVMVNDSITKDSLVTDLKMFAIDIYYDAPLNKQKGTALSFYGSYFNTDFGKGYLRNLGVMSPTNGVQKINGTFNGTGNVLPTMGTGQILYAQIGFLLPNKILGNFGKLQPYAAYTHSNFDRLYQSVKTYDFGFNWLINNHNSKMSINYQSRPIFKSVGNTIREVKSERKGCYLLQYQVTF